MKRVIVLSLGGSLIVPDQINYSYLKNFKKQLTKLSKNFKFVVVCGGGSTARKYIQGLKKEKLNAKFQSLVGIASTRINARFMNYFFGFEPEYGIPHTEETLKKYIKKRNVVFCGALEYKPDQTSDSTAAELAKHFKTIFINLTNVPGLHDKNPLTHKDAKFISKISWKDFEQMANKIEFKPGQHFVLDQTAAKVIRQNKIPTYIVGKDVKQLSNLLKNKKFKGTKIND